jgi:hypothetical protein
MRSRNIIAAALVAISSPAIANDSSSALALGGIELRESKDISMDSEELFISQARVTVRYRFTNTSAKDITTLIAFPLPEMPGANGEYFGDSGPPDWTALDFKTRVDGTQVKLGFDQTAKVGGRVINDRLKQLGWPINYWRDDAFYKRVQLLSHQQERDYAAEGLLKGDENGYGPAWSVTTNVTRTQTFSAGKTVTVEHSYVPVAGSSVAGNLHKSSRRNYPKQFSDYAKSYCIDKPFITAFDRVMAKQRRTGDGQDGMYVEHWLGYVLKSGANWKGPIKDFRLIVDKGKAENLVSFCMDGVKKISPTQFEVRKTNFEPAKDLRILIVGFWDPQ